MRLAAAIAGVLLIGCSPTVEHPPVVVLPPPTLTLQEAVVALHNDHRRNSLESDDQLADAVQSHADWMAERRRMSHRGRGGSNPGQRISASGYSWSTYGENIAYGQQTPESVMRAWLGSPGHRRNIKSSSYGDIGVGIATADNGQKYWCVTFGSKSYNGEEWSGSWATPEWGDE